MLEKRYVAGKWIYRAPGAFIWSYSQTDAIERAKQATQEVHPGAATAHARLSLAS
jgi:hypothetical protein